MITVKEDRRNRQSFFSIENATPRIRRGIRAELATIGAENVKYTKRLIKDPPKTGKWYWSNGKWHRASAPGQPPADDTGVLRRGVAFRVYSWERMEFGDTVFYGKFLELGTSRKAKNFKKVGGSTGIQPREHLARTVRVKSRDNFKALQEVVNRVINKR